MLTSFDAKDANCNALTRMVQCKESPTIAHPDVQGFEQVLGSEL